jgi:ribonuclease D
VVTRLATEHSLPPENLVAPDAIRRLAWTPPQPISPGTVAAALAGTAVRPWQIGLLADELAVALVDPV